jgi:ribosome-binding factor A
MNTSSIRAKRLGGTIQKYIGAELSRELADPRLSGLAIEAVEMTGDLGLALCKVRLMFGDTPDARKGAMRALEGVAPMLRSRLAPILKMRRVPEIRFVYDEGTDHQKRIEALLNEIKSEDAGRETPKDE